MGGIVHLTPLKTFSGLSSRICSLMSSVYVALRCGSTRPSTIGDAIACAFDSGSEASVQESRLQGREVCSEEYGYGRARMQGERKTQGASSAACCEVWDLRPTSRVWLVLPLPQSGAAKLSLAYHVPLPARRGLAYR